ncbi:MAG: DMT family transporter [Actinomycetota bacterium]|nr:DMT family transporter [Actinomycetota bacterium]
MDVALALVAAFFFALGLVLQEKAASVQPASAVGAGFLVRLVRNPVWLLGAGSQMLGFVAQAIALGIGRMVIVQPLLVATIVFALPIARVVTKRVIRGVEWIGALIVAAGLAALLIVSKTAEGREDAPLGLWMVVGGVCIGIAILLFVLARGRSPALRAGLLGTAAGILFGFAAALIKTTVARLDEGLWEVVWDWHVYAMIALSVGAVWLQQAALQTGALSAAVASTMAFDPLSSIPIGIIIFDEQLHETAFGITVSVAALAATLFGLVLLARAKGAEPAPEAALAPAAAT